MTQNYKELLNRAIENIAAHLPPTASADEQNFIRQYYARMPVMDIENIRAARACDIAHSSYEFLLKRTLGEPKIRVFRPREDEHGWRSSRLIVEILGDDMPFLVDSITAEITRQGFTIHKTIHPIIRVRRDDKGQLLEVPPANTEENDILQESLIHLQLSALPEGVTEESLINNIKRVLKAVRLAVTDWRKILDKCEWAEEHLEEGASGVGAEEIRESKEFLHWLRQKNFVFLGSIEYNFYDDDGNEKLQVVPGSELGIFKMEDLDLQPRGLEALPPEMLHFALLPHLIEITKANRKSIVHRAVHMDYIGIKRFDASGKVIGELRLLGLFTSIVYYQSADNIPIIRHKIKRVLNKANFDETSHDGKALKAILEFSPRDELFQMSEDDLFNYAIGVLSLEARPTVRLFVRQDLFQRFVSCMVFVPRDRFSTSLRQKIQAILEKAFSGEVTAFYTQMTDSPLARAHLIVKTTPGEIPKVNIEDVESQITKVTNLWTDSLHEALLEAFPEQKAERLFRMFGKAFPEDYINLFEVSNAVYDIGKMDEQLEQQSELALELFRTHTDEQGYIHLKIYNPNEQMPLSEILPMLENMGFKVVDEHPFRIQLQGKNRGQWWIRDLRLFAERDADLDVTCLKDRFEEAFGKVWARAIENDRLNSLVVVAGLSWRDVMLLRAIAKYARQAAFTYSYDAICRALIAHPQIVQDIIKLFHIRFAPAAKFSADKQEKLCGKIDQQLSQVPSLEEDRILRQFMAIILATLRTNYFQKNPDGGDKSYISFKFDSAKIPDLPLPRPFREIFVYSLRVEGIHLRGGKVARGGLRWSDRREDFRTEILGLMKAQMVKNSVIVPVGSKGGFVVKQPPPAENGREAFMSEGIECYKTFLRGMLDITDNIVKGKIVPPPEVVRHDEDDPYLVVAADKGTASFSDYANGISAEYGFWLGDAFASGGSAGYDHKKMGITARGAWVSVQRHFREMGIDVQSEDFTAVGIGDMSGDVFGNGMLLSEHIRLVGAFNHLHIFIDPNPDAAKSFKERKRLFELPRSGWADYNPKLISAGGGVFERSAKEIPLTAEMRKLLGVKNRKMTPDELIKALLLAPVDLLWNGGIGTYVKAESESHDQVGDRANNNVRVNGSQLRCKVVGEGGNLGFTQLGRIEYALAGGRINNDAIDNSAGVDCSDHEVNIKIALAQAEEQGKLNRAERDKILAEMTGDVGDLVLIDNRLQTQAITVSQLQGVRPLEQQAHFIRSLERKGLLDREVEFLPSDKQIVERRNQELGLTRPELSVLMAYSKNVLYQQLLDSSFPDDEYLSAELMRYFPQTMRDKFADEIESHQLRREIIATVATNSIVNRSGITFWYTLREDTGMEACDIARAYTIARDAFDIRDLWRDIEALDGKIPVETQAAMFTQATIFVERASHWFLRNCPQPLKIRQIMDEYKPGIASYIENWQEMISDTMTKAYENKIKRFTDMGADEYMAQRMARLEAISSACDVVMVTNRSGLPLLDVGKIYFELGAKLRLGWLRRCASRMTTETYWDRLAVESIINNLADQQRRLTAAVISSRCQGSDCSLAIAGWYEMFEKEILRFERFIDDLKTAETITFPMLIIAQRHVESICSV